MRKLASLLLVFSLFVSMVSCTNCHHGLDKDKKDIILQKKEGVIEFQGEEYYKLENNIFGTYSDSDRETRYKNFSLISWSYNFPFTGVIVFYSYSSVNPNFIVEPYVENTVWFKKTFDYQTEIFVVENTEIEVVFSSAFENGNINIGTLKYDAQSFYWHAKSYPSLRTKVDVFSIDGIYYMKIPDMDDAYQISDDFLNLLIDNAIILTN